MIIPAYRAEATLPRVLAALRPQIREDVEVLVVDSSGPDRAEALQRAHGWLKVISLPERTLPGRARNLGVIEACGSQLAFLDADAVPGPEWLAHLRQSLNESEHVAVAGAVMNGTPGSGVGTALYLLEFSEWNPLRLGAPNHAASCNLLVRRDAFEAAGGFPEGIWPGEDTIMTFPWGNGHKLGFARDAPVWHLNRTRLRELLRHQYRLGVAFASICDQVEFPYRALSRWPLLMTAPALRIGALVLRLRRQHRLRAQALMITPQLMIGLAGWSVGLTVARVGET